MTDKMEAKLAHANELYGLRDEMSFLKIDTRAIDDVISKIFDDDAPTINSRKLSRARTLLDIRPMLKENTEKIDKAIALTFDASFLLLGENIIEQARKMLELKGRMERNGISTLAVESALLKSLKVNQ